MYRILTAAVLLTLVVGLHAAEEQELSDRAKLSYGIGFQAGNHAAGMKLDKEQVIKAIEDAFAGKESAIPEAEIRQAYENYQAGLAKDLVAEDDKFLKEIAGKEGVKKTESGLMYEVITEGDGPKPAATDTVEVHYAGKTVDGNEFDSSYKRGETTSFGLNQVIKGWTEGLQLMPVGSKYRLYIPGELGYGPKQAGGSRPSGVLIFDVELIAIK